MSSSSSLPQKVELQDVERYYNAFEYDEQGRRGVAKRYDDGMPDWTDAFQNLHRLSESRLSFLLANKEPLQTYGPIEHVERVLGVYELYPEREKPADRKYGLVAVWKNGKYVGQHKNQ